jgi:serine/threonine protein kinase/tetratricopeptide (TPR) repeat protein
MKCPKCHSDNLDEARFCRSCGTDLQVSAKSNVSTWTLQHATEELSRGTVFAGRYEVIELLGTGGMGRVYRVLDTKINEEMALKLIRPEIASDKKTIERFSNELRLARHVSHKHVCRMYDLGEDAGIHYITMEYVPGESLKSMIKMTKQLSASTAISIAKQVCGGLAEAHKYGVVHRDLKPGNIMIDKDGNVRIMDFGIARSLEAKEVTETGMLIGTPEYMSPEQVTGEGEDHRSDIYSLGIILYEMLTGRLPFEGKTPISIAMKHQREIPKSPQELNPQIPDSLVCVILKCMEKKKEMRYQNAVEILTELNKSEGGRQITSPKVKKIAYLRRWMLVAALLVAVVVVGIGYRLIFDRKPMFPSERNMLVVLPFGNLGSPEDGYFADGITDEITNRLATLHRLGVISRTSAIQYKNTDKTIKQIAGELNVDYVLEGSVRWNRSPAGRGRIRVTSQLVRVTDDTQVWSESYDRVIDDVFSVQSEIAEQVAQQLDLTVLEPERKLLNARPTENLRAYDYYLRGREHEDRGWAYLDNQEFALALEMLDKATDLDPGFTLAYVRKSYIHSRMYFFAVDRTEERLAKSWSAVTKALELQPDSPEAHRILAFYYYWGLSDYDRAAEIFESVQKSAPNFDPQVLGYIQRRQGRWEQCLETLERAFRINPRDTQIAYELGGAYISMRRYEEAEKWFDRALAIYPDHLPAQLGKIGISVLSEGNTKKALAALEKVPPHQLKDYMWFTLNMLERNYDAVLDWIASLSYDSYEDQHFYFQKDLAYASVYYAMKEFSLMKTRAESASSVLEEAVDGHAEDPRFHAALGLAYAYLDRKEEAIQEGSLAEKLHPVSKDAAQGPIYLLNLAKIYTVIGEHEKAIDQLEYLLSIPHAEYLWQLVSVPQLQLDPQWDSLREHPRFKDLLEISSLED